MLINFSEPARAGILMIGGLSVATIDLDRRLRREKIDDAARPVGT
jgi:hypothetical protein